MEKSKQQEKLIVTHGGSFHSDDIFACAVLSLYLGGNIKIVRTRDSEIIETADFVVDVGGVYDPLNNRFDHHQKGGAGIRENAIPYAAFGLVWKTYGEELCGSKEIADKIDRKLVQPTDAGDNGISISKPIFEDLYPYELYAFFSLFIPTWKENDLDTDSQFLKVVDYAKEIIQREIKKAKDQAESIKLVKDIYQNTEDKRIVIVDLPLPAADIQVALAEYEDPLYVVFMDRDEKRWRVGCVRKNKVGFENRKDLPASWAGLKDRDLQEATGVSDAIFCHNKLFLAGAISKGGAIELANLALKA